MSQDRKERALEPSIEELLHDSGPFKTLFDRSPDGMVLLDPHDPVVVCPIVACNESAARMNGYEREELLGKPISLLTRDPDTHEELQTYVDRLRAESIISEDDIHYRKNGTEFPLEFSTVLVNIGDREFILGVDRDITQRKLLEDALARQAMYDNLTDLPNRTFLRSELAKAIDDAESSECSFALLFMDLDKFKEINDSFGHLVGDQALKEVAGRIKALVGPRDTVARLGGDEFAMVLPGARKTEAIGVMRTIVDALKTPIWMEKVRAITGVSVGCSLYPEDGTDVMTLMRRADRAMYAAKRGRLGYVVYSKRFDRRASAADDVQGTSQLTAASMPQ